MTKIFTLLLSTTAALAASQTASAQYGKPYYPAPGCGNGYGYGAQPYGVPTGYNAYTLYGDGRGPGFPRLSPVTIQPYVGSPGSPVDMTQAYNAAWNCGTAAAGTAAYAASASTPAAPLTIGLGAAYVANSWMECADSIWPNAVTTPREYITNRYGSSAGAALTCSDAAFSLGSMAAGGWTAVARVDDAMALSGSVASCLDAVETNFRSGGTAMGAFDTPRSGSAMRADTGSPVGGGGSWSAGALTFSGSFTTGSGGAPRYSAGATIDLSGLSVFNTQSGGTPDAAVSDRKSKP